MAVRFNITQNHEWFTNTARNLDFEVLNADPEEDVNATPTNIVGFNIKWTFSDTNQIAAVKHINGKTASIVGVFNAVRSLNTQRARVTVLATETNIIPGDVTRYHELRRTDVGAESVLCFGDAYLCQSPV